ncbi:MAG: putative CRISPR-associated protein [Oscillatoriales cyanobacterium RM2_1_1]|nr:putative CRISPR-associated protein [Oscillatoriales cyanobacterium SM2_3_0]NJO47803.1 putative CRISPR-associated protein [Oscillatoriales cyanobacterium RM2_1_1]
MPKPLYVLSPCGTSLLTNGANDEQRKLVVKYANTKSLEEISEKDRKTLQDRTEIVGSNLEKADNSSAARMSAELNGIIKLCEGSFNHRQDYHLLLCTDTWLGETTANLVESWLKKQQLSVEVKRQSDLRTEDINSFQLALSDLVQWCEQIIPGYRRNGYHVVFNLTGGFKSVQGFLQTLATFYADETIYIFETATDLLRIPRLPVEMAAESTVEKNLETFRRLSLYLSISNIADVPETLLIKVDEKVGFSPWGELVWAESKKKVYCKQLYSPPTDKLKYGSSFEKSIKGLPPDRLVQVNEKIDQLTKYLETNNNQYNLSSLDFKELKGNPCPPSTHEIDAWSDQDAKRIFGHYAGDKFILDKLDKGLH